MLRADSAELFCHACTGELEVGEEYLQCMVKTCGKLYHRLCTGQKLTLREKDTWVCPECCIGYKKGGRNCDTPVGTPVTVKNISSRNTGGGSPPASPLRPAEEPSRLELEMQRMREQMSLLSQQLAGAVSVIAQYHSALSDYAVKFELLHDRFEKLEQTLSCPKLSTVTVASGPNGDETGRKPETRRKRNPKAQKLHSEKAEPLAIDVIEAVPQKLQLPPPSVDSETGRVDSSDYEESDKATAGEWREVRGKKRYSSVRCTAGPETTPLRAVEYRKYIHLWNMISGADEILAFLQSQSPNSSFTVDELKSKGEYKSFKIGVPAALLERCLSADLWPENARIRPWLFRKPAAKGRQS